jgi:hypothetical protein
MQGYLHPAYPYSLAEFGIPYHLPKSNGWILQRTIDASQLQDVTDCYPLFCCEHWSRLAADLAVMRDAFVALKIITDPFGEYDAETLCRCFPDRVTPFKEHFIVDLRYPLRTFVSKHHQRNAQHALKTLAVERCHTPLDCLADWMRLYATLIDRHQISGIQKFSATAFSRQFRVPGLVAFRAAYAGETVGMLLWYHQGTVAYYHLGAYSAVGYQTNASFALFWTAIEHFAQEKVRYLNLGAGAGAQADATDGLTRFKRGWANGQRTTYLCGRIFNHRSYEELVKTRGITNSTFFPAYRAPAPVEKRYA